MASSANPSLAPANTASDPAIEVYKAIRAHELMLNQATSAFEHAAAAPLVLLNGGAAVAYLTLLGAVSDPQKSKLRLAAAWAVLALIAWAAGLIAAQAAVTFGLASQRAYSRAQRIKREGLEGQLLTDRPELLRLVVRNAPGAQEQTEQQELGKRDGRRFDRARLTSAIFFLAGVALAAGSIA